MKTIKYILDGKEIFGIKEIQREKIKAYLDSGEIYDTIYFRTYIIFEDGRKKDVSLRQFEIQCFITK